MFIQDVRGKFNALETLEILYAYPITTFCAPPTVYRVESALNEHPAVAESAVIASPDEMRGEIVKACIVLAPSYNPSPELANELKEHVKRVTAPYKYPREIEFMESLPKTISGRIRRVELRKLERKMK